MRWQAKRDTALSLQVENIQSAVAASLCRRTPKSGDCHFRVTPTINRNRKNNQRADDDFLNIVGPTHLLASVAQEGHDQRANHRAEYAAFSATEAAATDPQGGDYVQLQAGGHSGTALPQTRHLHHTGQPKKQAGQSVDVNLQAISRDATGASRSFI